MKNSLLYLMLLIHLLFLDWIVGKKTISQVDTQLTRIEFC